MDRRNLVDEMAALLAQPVAEAMTPELEVMLQKLRDTVAKLKAMQAKKPKPKTLDQVLTRHKSMGERSSGGVDDFDLGDIAQALDQFRALRIAAVQKAKGPRAVGPKKGRPGK